MRQERLARARRPYKQNIAFIEFDIVRRLIGPNALIMIIYGNRKNALGALLTNHIVVETGLNFLRLGQPFVKRNRLFEIVFSQNLIAELDTLTANIHARASDDLIDLIGTLATKRTANFCSGSPSFHNALLPHDKASSISGVELELSGLSTSSIRPYSFDSSADIKKSRSASFSMRAIG